MTARRATSADFSDLARVLDTHWGTRDSTGLDYARALAGLDAAGAMAAWIIESDGAIVSYGVGFVAQRLPSPFNPTGRFGYVQSMMTRPDVRRRGFATAVLTAMLAWIDAQDATVVQLVASDDGAPLYARRGFAEDAHGLPMVRFVPTSDGR